MAIGKLEGEEKLPEGAFLSREDGKINISYQPGDTLLTKMKENFRREK